MKITGNEPAQPLVYAVKNDAKTGAILEQNIYSGLTIRQQFASQFYAARLTGLAMNLSTYSTTQLASLSVADADALIAELNKEV